MILNRKAAANLILAQPKPDYPALAKLNYIQGRVRMQVLVSGEGKVTEANVVQGHPFLAAAALNAVRRWKYKPFQTIAGPVPFVTVVEVNFSLRNIQPDHIPPEAVKDLNRQVRPPQVLDKPPVQSNLVHMRVLVNEEGQAIDVNPIEGFPSDYDAVMRMAGHFRFEPARWGTITVPWYLDVEVPAQDPPIPVPASKDM
ncbi:MAG TPA: energy transducer TonB [Terriglobia bacterium]|nr:energy transducer TonB [Terriglobia bacterium]